MALKRTPLYQWYLEENFRLMPFGGWEMPVQFSGLVNEHNAVRQKAGLFDISHMGVFRIEGENAKHALQKLVPTDLNRIGKGEAAYSVLLNESGGIIDDLIIYDQGKAKDGSERLLIIINAGCIQRDIGWLQKYLDLNKINICDMKENGILLALQGPDAARTLDRYFISPVSQIPKFGHRQISLGNISKENSSPIFISRTGYTGEDGFEILLSSGTGKELWKQLLKDGISPCGLGARDTLRLEAAMNLYGNEMNDQTTPFEAGLGWLVHLEMPIQFIGREVLENQVRNGIKRRLVGLELEDRAIPRKGYRVFHENKQIGTVTSGTWSPTLSKGIALASVESEMSQIGQRLFVEIRGKQHQCKVVKKPFYRKGS